jgi:hypothetical protein
MERIGSRGAERVRRRCGQRAVTNGRQALLEVEYDVQDQPRAVAKGIVGELRRTLADRCAGDRRDNSGAGECRGGDRPPPDVSGLPGPGGSAPRGLAGLEAAGRGTSEDGAEGTGEAGAMPGAVFVAVSSRSSFHAPAKGFTITSPAPITWRSP